MGTVQCFGDLLGRIKGFYTIEMGLSEVKSNFLTNRFSSVAFLVFCYSYSKFHFDRECNSKNTNILGNEYPFSKIQVSYTFFNFNTFCLNSSLVSERE